MKIYKNHPISVSLCILCFQIAYTSQIKARPYEGTQVSSTLFNDNIWFFGDKWIGTGCPCVAFVKDNPR